MHFRHILAKIQPKNLKRQFDWWTRTPWASLVYALAVYDVYYFDN